jgi:prepilin-type processing-associated H-X9-DG protein
MADKRMSDHVSSFHGGGSVAAFCDGHVQFVRDDIEYRVYQHLMTPSSSDAYNTANAELSTTVNVLGVLDEAEF